MILNDTGPLPPPNDLHLVEVYPDQLVFNWTEESSKFNCPHFYYRLTSSNCGQCPNATTNTTATCTGNYTTNSSCLFTVQSVLCEDIIGDARTTIVEIELSKTPHYNRGFTQG